MAMEMRVLGTNLLQAFCNEAAGRASAAAVAWRAEMSFGTWHSAQELLARFPTAIAHDPDYVLFYLWLGGPSVLTRINYSIQHVLIKACSLEQNVFWPPTASLQQNVRS